ncbi:hypothetical protein [Singulisphaera acidiphila]|uniref:Uncharacterized protein n=1 Tax=Singulisphaera acidiphila (strain ATCC BAA-1392 / DSM 18658 / VKM B-2454 / MOB10) TaxID=886293 RepID=L0DH47_SINAD|nr:hypothetical protein [Singulisphaera acidiphila]AGA28582.1 hypothetical protein Sinac_4391 [Singulisphaera acidiphila DSM 18658]
MSDKGIPLSRMMKFTALIALNCALVKANPSIPQSPLLLFALVMLDIVLVQAVILGHPLRAFHYTFLVVGFAASLAITEVAFMPTTTGKRGSLHLLETLIRRQESIANTISLNQQLSQYLEIAERGVTNTLGLLVAWVVGLSVARQVRRRRGLEPGRRIRHIGSFFQGALIGLGIFTSIVCAINFCGLPPNAPRQGLFLYAFLLSLAILPLLGGFAVMYLNQRRDPSSAADQGEPAGPSQISAS